MVKVRAISIGIATIVTCSGVIVGSGTSAQAATPTCGASYSFSLSASSAWVGLPVVDDVAGLRSTTCILRQGGNAAATRDLQSTLRYCYSGNLVVDGAFGPKTAAALKVVQSKVGVTADGVYGPVTGAKLHWFSAESTCLSMASFF
jgi:peptidoglycan hydrolase-like protein with peptidoglycan-binding domain